MDVFTIYVRDAGGAISTASSGTAMAYTGVPGAHPPPTPNDAVHPAQEHHGPAEMILVATVAGVIVWQRARSWSPPFTFSPTI